MTLREQLEAWLEWCDRNEEDMGGGKYLTPTEVRDMLKTEPTPTVTAEQVEYGVYLYGDSTFYKVNPPTQENADRELALCGEPGEVVTVYVGRQMQNAANHARRKALSVSGDKEVKS